MVRILDIFLAILEIVYFKREIAVKVGQCEYFRYKSVFFRYQIGIFNLASVKFFIFTDD